MNSDLRFRSRFWSRMFVAAALVVILLAYWLLAVAAMSEKCTTFDEIIHVTGGYSYWLTCDFRLQPENGNLPQRFGAVPLLLSAPTFPTTRAPGWRESNAWEVGDEFFYHLGNDPDEMLFEARAVMACAGVGVLLLVFFWSWKLFGLAGGFLSLLTGVFCPSMLAHGPLVTSDMTASFFFLASVSAWWRLLHHLSLGTSLVCALSLSGLFLSKFSAVLFLPMGLLLLLLRLWSGVPWALDVPASRGAVASVKGQVVCFVLLSAAMLLSIWLAIWTAYGFRYAIFASNVPGQDRLSAEWEQLMPESGLTRVAVEFARSHQLLPEAYLFGFVFTTKFAQQRSAFLNGDYSTQGWFSFFPYAFLVKTPLPFLVLLACAAGGLTSTWLRADRTLPLKTHVWRSFYSAAPLWVLFGAYWVFALTSKLNIGHRHILPTYAVLFVFAGAASYWLRFRGTDEATTTNRARNARQILGAGCVSVALVLLIVESLHAFPNYLAYFNRLAGGPPHGYRHLVDSSLDWGQDLPGLKEWLDMQVADPGVAIYFSYFGAGSPEYYGIKAHMLPSFVDRRTVFDPADWQEGIYCISATMLQGVYSSYPGPWTRAHEDRFQLVQKYMAAFKDAEKHPERKTELPPKVTWQDLCQVYDDLRFSKLCHYLRSREPDAQIGFSILIYHLKAEELHVALKSSR